MALLPAEPGSHQTPADPIGHTHPGTAPVLLSLLVAFPLACVVGLRLGDPFNQLDASHYLRLAAGLPAMLPFAMRQLAPLAVRALHASLHLSIESAFLLEGLLALLVVQCYVAWSLVRAAAPQWIAPAVLGLFFWTRQFNGLVFPDLLYAALLSGFLLLLGARRMTAAALLLFPLMLARESTLLTLACFLVAARRELRIRHMLLALGSAAAGLVAVHELTLNALPNQEHLSPALYMLAKVPWNLAKNVFGVSLWANVYPACALPRWQTPIPFGPLGPLQAVGLCGFNFDFPLNALAAGLASFGLLPLLLLRLPGKVPPANRLLLRFCVVYGGLSFLLAPLLGELFARLFDFGWPLFLVGLPLMLGVGRQTFRSATAAVGFLTLHLLLSWSPLWLGPAQVVAAALVLGLAGWILLGKTWIANGGTEPEPPPSIPPPASAII